MMLIYVIIYVAVSLAAGHYMTHIVSRGFKKICQRFDRIDQALGLRKEDTESMMNVKQAIADLTEQVRANTDAEAAASAMITSIADRIKDAENDAGAIATLTQELRNSAGTLGAAVVANTTPTPNPAPPTPAPGTPGGAPPTP